MLQESAEIWDSVAAGVHAGKAAPRHPVKGLVPGPGPDGANWLSKDFTEDHENALEQFSFTNKYSAAAPAAAAPPAAAPAGGAAKKDDGAAKKDGDKGGE